MGCDCGKPKCDGHCGVSPAVLQINNPSECVLFHRVEVPASMGDSKTNPPKSGAYKNVLLYYEADQTSWLYSSDGIPQKLVNGLTNYEDAIDLPQINGVTLLGDKNSADLKLADAPMVITIASGNAAWSGADTAEDIYNFFLNQGKVNVVFEGSENYGYEIVSAAYIPGEQKMMCMTTVASVDTGSSPVEFSGSALYGLMTFCTVDKAVDVGELDLQPKLSITDFTGLSMTDGYVLEGVPATDSSIGMVKPGDGLSVSPDGTLTVINHVFDTVADMKAATNLVDGSYAQTLGFHTINDGGGALYNITNTGIANEMDVIAVGSLYANLVIPAELTPEQVGCYGDGTHDDTTAFALACTLGDKIIGKGEYLLGNITLNNVDIKADIKSNSATGLTFNNNVKYEGTLTNNVSETLANAGRCIYIIGKNNIITNSNFTGIFKGACIVIADTAYNTIIEKSYFDACFKIDVNVAGVNTIIDENIFAEHTSETVADLTVYCNGIKVSQYLDTSGSNGNKLIIKNNTLFEHGDNTIDCYTGCTDVIIDGNFIYSPLHECIEIKCVNNNEYNTKYIIVNNNIYGARCMYVGNPDNGHIDKFIVANNLFRTTEAGCIITYDVFDITIDNCIFEGEGGTGAEGVTYTYAIQPSQASGATSKVRVALSNCIFTDMYNVINEASDSFVARLSNAKIKNVYRCSRVNADSEWFISNSDIETVADSFGSIKGKIFVNNCKLKNTFSFVINGSTGVLSLANSIIDSSTRVINVNGTNTPKVCVMACDYGATQLCNKTLSPAVNFTTIPE